VSRLTSSKAWTASGDGTTFKGVNAVSHFATYPPIPITNKAEGEAKCSPHRRFLGITREVNHKTSTQLENWIGLLADISSVYNKSPFGSKNPVATAEIGRKATGYSADHAADQVKLSKELYAYKQSCDHQLRGAEAMKSKSVEDIKEVVDEKFGNILTEVGNWEGWETRSREEREKLLERLINEVCTHFGKLAFAELPEVVRRIVGLWHWSGCCMHKDLNTFKGGATRMSAFWKEAGLKGPVKLLSRQKEELVGADVTDCELGSGGAAKLADLVGALVRNKEETKGFPDEFRTYSMAHLAYEISFPDTSNTRYQCYGDAATELIWHPDFYIGFLDQHGKKKKRAAGLNHMEMNILKGLEDPETRTELAVFALYSEAVSKPYAISVRGTYNESKNALDLGPDHLKIITHVDTLIKNPSLLIGDQPSHKTGALYGTCWDQDIIDHIHSIHNQLPYLQQALIAFLQGAREKWVDFIKEYAEGSDISNSTAEERLLSFRPPTNDHSEGSGGMWKGSSRFAPSMTTHQKNARIFLQLNSSDIETFSDFPEPVRMFARGEAREVDAAGLPAKEREKQAKADREAADEEQREVERLRGVREAKEAKELTMIRGFQPILDLTKFLTLPDSELKSDLLKRQLVWHRRVGGDKKLPLGTFSNTKKSVMKDLVAGALARRTCDEGEDVDMVDSCLGSVEDSSIKSDGVAVIAKDGDDFGNRNRHDFSPHGTLVMDGQLETAYYHGGPSVLPGGRNPLPMNFGCIWDPVDHSCAYDCVFTAFTWIYLHATRVWQERWAGESPTASFLSDCFQKISSGLPGPTPNHTVPALFAEGRDAWRDRLSQSNPNTFPRRGPNPTTITMILEILADDRNPSHYATIVLSCGTPNCPLRIKNLDARYYILTPSDWNTSTGQTMPPHHESLETWIEKHYSSRRPKNIADRCARCQRQFSRKLAFLEPTWIWLEVFPEYDHIIIPALEISLGSTTMRLAAVMYHGGDHYRARFCDPSGAWWFYDGLLNGGRPTPALDVSDEGDLFRCGSGYMITALVYCLVG